MKTTSSTSQGFLSHVITSVNTELKLVLILSQKHLTQVGPLPCNPFLNVYYSSSITNFVGIVQKASDTCLKSLQLSRVEIHIIITFK